MSTKSEIKNITILGIIINIVITSTKFIFGIIGNSQALIADATHSLSDFSTDIAILFGVKFWTSPPDEKHQYGHQKIESIVTIIIGIILLSAAAGIGYNSISTIDEKHTKPLSAITIIGPVISILFKEYLFRITYKKGIKLNSSSLKANAWHHRSDSLSSFPVLIAIIAALINPKLIFLDHIGAMIVAAFIVKVAIEVMYSSIGDLLDTAITSEELQKISKILNDNPDILGFHKIRTRKLGSSIYVDFHLEVKGNLTVERGHSITEIAKSDIIKSNPRIIDVMVHLEPAEKNKSNKNKKKK